MEHPARGRGGQQASVGQEGVVARDADQFVVDRHRGEPANHRQPRVEHLARGGGDGDDQPAAGFHVGLEAVEHVRGDRVGGHSEHGRARRRIDAVDGIHELPAERPQGVGSRE